MYLGPRINIADARNNSFFMQAIGPYVDILAVNYYGIWTPNSVEMHNWGTNLQKPFMVTEFYTKGDDSGLANNSGAGWIVKTQLERGYAYQNFTLALLESKYCVGWHWFKYFDNDPSIANAEPSNIDGNKGIVNILYEPYLPLVNKMKELNLRVYNLIDYFDNKKGPIYVFAEADAYFQGAVNHGVDDRLGIKYTTDINYFREAFVRFDLKGQSQNVSEVNLCLNILRAVDAGVTYKAEFVADDAWAENEITATNNPVAISEIGQWAHNSDLKLNVKEAYLATLDADKKLSIKLSGVTTSASQLEFASRENITEGSVPRIEIIENGLVDSTSADLVDLIVQNKRVYAFRPNVLDYNIVLPSATKTNPAIAFETANSGIHTNIVYPLDILSPLPSNRVAKITASSADGLKQKIYTLNFEIDGLNTNIGTSRNDNIGESGFIFYPNPVPANGSIAIEISGVNTISQISVNNLNGQAVFSAITNWDRFCLDLNNKLDKGVYQISVKTLNGFFTNKLIIK
jgi:hypothetical protein